MIDATIADDAQIDVSFVIASYNSGNFLVPAVLSALGQSGVRVEVIIIDDGSTDGSLEVAQELSKQDDRVRVIRTAVNSGPGGARNLGLHEMRGNWYAVLDSDDLIKPERSRYLIDVATANNADLIADDLEIFGDEVTTHRLVNFDIEEDQFEVTLDSYFERSLLFGKRPGYGFLKPMIHSRVIRAETLRYDERLRVGEDDELIVRLLASGYRYLLVNRPFYMYRKHGHSISHRLSVKNAQKMVETEHKIQKRLGEQAKSKLYRRRYASIKTGLSFVESIEKIKSGALFSAISILLRRPAAILLYKIPIMAALGRWRR